MRALVTGAGGRIGRALAVRLAERGHDVAVHFSSAAEGAEETAGMIRALGRRAATLGADLLDEAAAQGLVARATESLGGPLNVLVNSASIFDRDSWADATRAGWDRHMGIHARAPFVLAQAFAAQAPEPVSDEGGEPVAQALVVNVIDQRVLKLTPEFATYTLSRAGPWRACRWRTQASA